MKIHEALKIIQSKLVAPKGQKNTFGNYKYRSCEDILEAVKPLLKETETLLIIQDEIVLIGDRYYVKATAILKSGAPQEGSATGISVSAFARESLSKKGMDDSQITGSTSSYARKYALNGLFCIDDTKDADTMDNSKKEEPKKENHPAQEAKTMNDIVSELAKEKFKDPDEYKAWRVDNGLAENLKETNDFELTKVLMKLKEI